MLAVHDVSTLFCLTPQVGFEPTTLQLTAEPVVTDSIATARLEDTEADSLGASTPPIRSVPYLGRALMADDSPQPLQAPGPSTSFGNARRFAWE
jgi:hypothetical protein